MKTWLITGCSSGLGKGLAEAVLEHGDQAVVTARRTETLRHFTDRYPRTALALPLDVSDDAQAEAAVKAALPDVTYTGVSGSIAFDEQGDACAAPWKNAPWTRYTGSSKRISLVRFA